MFPVEIVRMMSILFMSMNMLWENVKNNKPQRCTGCRFFVKYVIGLSSGFMDL